MTKQVVLFSGGVDSATALTQAVRQHGTSSVLALYCWYDSKHGPIERHYARTFAHRLDVDLREVDVRPQLGHVKSSLLNGQDGEMTGAPTVVPGRNRVLIHAAAEVAREAGAGCVVFSPHAGDAEVYEDCRPRFVKQIRREILPLRLLTPWLYLPKSEIVRVGAELGVDWACVWSCYCPSRLQRPCGECGACEARRSAFADADVEDTL